MNKNGDWIGTPVTVDRSVNDLVLVDNALNDSMLGSRVTAKKDESCEREKIANDDEISKDNIMNVDEAPEITNPETSDAHNDIINTIEKDDNNKEADEDHEPRTITDENDEDKDRPGIEVRKSTRKRVQRMTIEADDIGDCDTNDDPDYRG